MNIEVLQRFCLQLPHTTEEIKWGNDLCFMIARKMYCIADASEHFGVAFKCSDEDYALLLEREGIIPAPYMARNKWVKVTEPGALQTHEWEKLVAQSYTMVASKLPKKTRLELGLV